MMIGPEQGKKTTGKSGKKKGKAKKAKRRAAELDLGAPTASAAERATPLTAAPDPVAAPDPGPRPSAGPETAAPAAGTVPGVGPDLLTWIDRVQERVDHLLTLVDPAVAAPATEPDPTTATVAENEPTTVASAQPRSESAAEPAVEPESDPEPATEADPETTGEAVTEPEPAVETATVPDPAPDGTPSWVADGSATSLAEAWARRQQQTVGPLEVDDDEPFEPGDARLTAVLVARELIARGESPADVRRRLREGYGVTDPEAVLAQVAA